MKWKLALAACVMAMLVPASPAAAEEVHPGTCQKYTIYPTVNWPPDIYYDSWECECDGVRPVWWIIATSEVRVYYCYDDHL